MADARNRATRNYAGKTSAGKTASAMSVIIARILYIAPVLSMWLIGTVRAEPETVISRAWVQSPDPAE